MDLMYLRIAGRQETVDSRRALILTMGAGEWRVTSGEEWRERPTSLSAFAFFVLPVNDQQLFLLSVPVAARILCNRRDPLDSLLGVVSTPLISSLQGSMPY